MVAAGLISRLIGLVGTLLVVRYISADDYGEAIVAFIVVMTASQVSQLGIGQFVIVKVGDRRDLAFHATICQLVLGAVAAGLVVLCYEPLGALVNAPGMRRYVPLMVVSMLIDRVALVPERVLMRDMRFRTVALARSLGECTYGISALTLAIMGWGGMAVAAANVARAAVRSALIVPFVDRRDWLEPCLLRLAVMGEIVHFGLPLGLGAFAGFIMTKWDNLLVSRFFGPAVMAAYNLAYNLAGMASGVVTEQVIDILVPTLTRLETERRSQSLLRAISLLGLVAMPLSFGLVTVAPTVVATVFREPWPHVAEMLAALAAVSALTPFVALSIAYFQACGRTKLVMYVQVVASIGILGSVAVLGRFGPLWTCAAVAIGGVIGAATAVRFVRSLSGFSALRLLATQVGALLACAAMAGGVLVVRGLLARAGLDAGPVTLAVEIAAGIVVYVGAASLFARSSVLDMGGLFMRAFRL
jgi:PST family polysaccharide transporter